MKRMVEWIAHRGESHLAPENTLPAIELAWANGADAVEIDVRLTRDGRLVLCHDPGTERTTGHKLVIAEHNADELLSLDAGSWMGAEWKGTFLPALEQTLKTIPSGPPASTGGAHRMFIEVKDSPDSLAPLSSAIADSGKQPHQIVIISFRVEVVREAKRLLPQHEVYWLVSRKSNAKRRPPTIDEMIATCGEIGADGLDIGPEQQRAIDEAVVRAARAAQLKLFAWTIDDPAEAAGLIRLGVDGITTNRPAWLRQTLESTGALG